MSDRKGAALPLPRGSALLRRSAARLQSDRARVARHGGVRRGCAAPVRPALDGRWPVGADRADFAGQGLVGEPSPEAGFPAVERARYLQMEQKIRAIIDFDLAANIPLVE